MTDFRTFEAERIRLLILQALAKQPNGSWTGAMIRRDLKTHGYPKTADFVRIQLGWLESEAMVVKLLAAGDDVIVTLRRGGRDHVEGVRLVAGIDQPDDEV